MSWVSARRSRRSESLAPISGSGLVLNDSQQFSSRKMDEGLWSFSICTDAIDKCGMVVLDENLVSRVSLRNRTAS